MRNHQGTTRGDLAMKWVPVQGVDGRVRMEARWISAAAVASKPNPHAA
ncbi:hypothetical protein [Nocardioides sp.]